MRSKTLLRLLSILGFCAVVVASVQPLLAAKPAKNPKAAAGPGRLVNICPERECSFGEWRARGDVAVYKDKNADSEVVFRAAKGDTVTGLGSELVVKKPGTCVAMAPFRAYEIGTKAPVTIKPKDRISTLYASGEGYIVGTFARKRVEASIDNLDCKSQPTNELWLKVKSQSGMVGWTNHREKFAGTAE